MKLSSLSKKMIFVIVVTSLVFIVGGVIFFRSFSALPFAFGVISTSALNIVKVIMLERTVQKVVDLKEKNAGRNFARLQYLLRFLLTGLVLFAAAKTPFIDFWGAIIGIFTLQIAAISVKFMKYDEII